MRLSWTPNNTILHGPTYESNVPYALRYMIDMSIVGGNWVELPAGSYSLVHGGAQQSHCQLEAHVAHSAVISHPCEGEWAKLAPFRILSVDIECQGRKVRDLKRLQQTAVEHSRCSLHAPFPSHPSRPNFIGNHVCATLPLLCRATSPRPSMTQSSRLPLLSPSSARPRLRCATS